MTTRERRQAIIFMLKQSSFIKTTDLCARFEVSGETVRRDLEFLQSQNVLQRIYGGAVLNKEELIPSGILDVNERGDIHAIACAAANLVLPGDTIFLDNGFTVTQIAHQLKNRSNLTVITSSLTVINELIDSDITLITLGGFISRSEGEISGDIAIMCAQYFYCDKVFFSCGGIIPEVGIMDFCSSTMPMHRHFYNRSKKYILVASSKKFGLTSTISLCQINEVDLIITDTSILPEYSEGIRDKGVDLMLIEPDLDS